MTPNEILRDFRTKYQGTFVWLKTPETHKEILCFIDAVAENRDRQAVIQLSSNEFGKLVINFASNHTMKFRFPTVGSFQHGKDSLIVQRRAPHRQYQRGLGPANHMLYACTGNFTGDVLSGPQMDLSTVESAFKQEKYRGVEAYEMLSKGKHRSIALGGHFSLTQSLDKNDSPMLFHDATFIGRVRADLTFVPQKGAEVLADEAQRALLEM